MRIIAGTKPEVKTYAITGSPRDIVFDQHEPIHIPEVDNNYRREVTRIDFADGTTVFSFDKVDAQHKFSKLEISSQMIDSMPPGELEKWVGKRARYEGIPAEATKTRHDSVALMMTVIEWNWWEVTL